MSLPDPIAVITAMAAEPGAAPAFFATETGFEERLALEGGGHFVRCVSVAVSDGAVEIQASSRVEDTEGQVTMTLVTPGHIHLDLRQARAVARALERAGDRLAIARFATGA